jgi:hypothetical protein
VVKSLGRLKYNISCAYFQAGFSLEFKRQVKLMKGEPAFDQVLQFGNISTNKAF